MSSDQDKHQIDAITQNEYVPTAYEDASWEVVGEFIDDEEFNPLEVVVLSRDKLSVDPMFADYGGIDRDPSPRRWHLPEHLSSEEKRRAADELEAAARKNVFSDDELATLLKETEEKAYVRALEEVVLKQHERFATIEERVKVVLSDLAKQVNEQLNQMERQAVKLSLDISGKVINHAVEVSPEYIGHIIQAAIAQCGSALISKIRVSPQDLEFIEVIGIQKHLAGLEGGWNFVADSSVRSGCVVETSAGEIDYQLDRAWEQVRDNILKAIE